MGILTDVYVATPQTAAMYDTDPRAFRDVTLEGKGIMEVELSILWALSRNEAWSLELCQQFEEVLSSDGGERIVLKLPDSLVTYLVESSEQAVEAVGVRWAATGEMSQFSQGQIQDYLGRLSALAKLARSDGRSLYLWVCV
ncbi:MAG TPA: hypothetical protein VHV55_23920 [Pirellulales bacterium]|jgi:hypothetical protein|nr:hypothetical protein [Pirellulales bacterium]